MLLITVISPQFGPFLKFVFAFLISTISSYKGYFTFGGALEIGQASTKAVTNSVIGILIADLILAKIMI